MYSKALLLSLLPAAMALEHFAIRQVDASLSAVLASASSLAEEASLCTVPASILSIMTSVPTLPADLASSLASDVCHVTCTGSLSSECKSYTSAVSAWSKSNEAVLSPWEATYTKTCTATGSCTATNTATNAAATGSGSNATGAGATVTSSAGAAQNTMMVVAAGAIAGAVGFVAAL